MAEAADEEKQSEQPKLSPEAQQALTEAEQRRRQAEHGANRRADEVGRAGPDPARYGDWEKNGIASDF